MQQKQQNIPDDSVEQVTFWQAFLFWLKLGFISFGGQLDKSL
ncbi:chromate ion transporter family chromate transporter [Acinetobacter nosocomialis]|nr:chromate ion transporter family chromate transporter [Acinetobacter nosocomialis]